MLKELFGSKKFAGMVVAILVFLVGRLGFEVDPGTMETVTATIMAWVISQGWADSGKEAAKIVAAAAKDPQSPLA